MLNELMLFASLAGYGKLAFIVITIAVAAWFIAEIANLPDD